MHDPIRLRDRIQRHRKHGRRLRRYPEPLRHQILEHVRARRARGESLAAIAASLGMSLYTLYEWLRETAVPRAAFRRVQVSSGPPARATLFTPHGYRVEGEVAALVDLLRRLS